LLHFEDLALVVVGGDLGLGVGEVGGVLVLAVGEGGEDVVGHVVGGVGADGRHVLTADHCVTVQCDGGLGELVTLKLGLLLLDSLHDSLVPRELIRLNLRGIGAAVPYFEDALLFGHWDDEGAGCFSVRQEILAT